MATKDCSRPDGPPCRKDLCTDKHTFSGEFCSPQQRTVNVTHLLDELAVTLCVWQVVCGLKISPLITERTSQLRAINLRRQNVNWQKS